MSAVISADGLYRYRLDRVFADIGPPPLVFCMLNPSKAGAENNDPTIRRCIGFAKREGSRGLIVVNLYAYRSTDPDILWKSFNPVGPDNYIHLQQVSRLAGRVICAWGTKAQPEIANTNISIFKSMGANLMCLGVNKDGSPKHPLYVKGDQPLIPFDLRSKCR